MTRSKNAVCIAAVISITLAGCATTKNATNRDSVDQKLASSDQNSANSKVNNAAKEIITQPFRDLGFMKKEIPPPLAQITDPYATPEGMDCAWISYQISQLDIVLPHEAVRAPSFDDRSDREKSADAMSKATDSAVNEAVRGAATSIVPVRGIVRKLSGAEKADSEYNAAIERGKIRRGYLRGLSFAKNCPTS